MVLFLGDTPAKAYNRAPLVEKFTTDIIKDQFYSKKNIRKFFTLLLGDERLKPQVQNDSLGKYVFAGNELISVFHFKTSKTIS